MLRMYDLSSRADSSCVSLSPRNLSDAEEQAVAVAFSAADDASITDCEFHIQEIVISSSNGVHCDENSEP